MSSGAATRRAGGPANPAAARRVLQLTAALLGACGDSSAAPSDPAAGIDSSSSPALNDGRASAGQDAGAPSRDASPLSPGERERRDHFVVPSEDLVVVRLAQDSGGLEHWEEIGRGLLGAIRYARAA